MKNLFIAIIVLVFAIGGFIFLVKGKKLEAPATLNNIDASKDEGSTAPVSNTMPVLGTGFEVEEMVVSGVKEFTVSGKNFSFTPSVITVKKGDNVRITFQNTEGFHDFVIDQLGATTKQSQSPSTEILEFTADKVGSFEYYCSVGTHRAMGMKGTLRVE